MWEVTWPIFGHCWVWMWGAHVPYVRLSWMQLCLEGPTPPSRNWNCIGVQKPRCPFTLEPWSRQCCWEPLEAAIVCEIFWPLEEKTSSKTQKGAVDAILILVNAVNKTNIRWDNDYVNSTAGQTDCKSTKLDATDFAESLRWPSLTRAHFAVEL